MNHSIRVTSKHLSVLLLPLLFLPPQVVCGDVTPRLITYVSANDGNTGWGDPASPYTHYILSFVVQATPNDDPTVGLSTAGGWTDGSLNFNASSGIVDSIHGVGKKALLAYGGSTMNFSHYSQYNDPGDVEKLADALAGIVRANNLDGIDIDWEDTAGFLGTGGYDGRKFLIDLTRELRERLPANENFEISHAPQPPYLRDLATAPEASLIAGYNDVLAEVGDSIDFLNMQYYNNPGFNSGEEAVRHYMEVVDSGLIDARKLVIGKPVVESNAGSGFLPVEQVRDEIIEPLVAKYGSEFGGAFNWEFKSDTNFEWGYTIAPALVSVPEPGSAALAGFFTILATWRRQRRN